MSSRLLRRAQQVIFQAPVVLDVCLDELLRELGAADGASLPIAQARGHAMT